MVETVIGSLRLVAAVWLLAAAALRFTPWFLSGRRPAPSECFLHVAVIVTGCSAFSVVLSGALNVLYGWVLLGLAGVIFILSRPLPPAAPPGLAAVRRHRRVLWPMALAAVVLGIDVLVFLPTSPVNWDAMTYHLYFPGRWVQEARLFHIPTVFSDNSSAFAPQNGALFFAWQMALLGADATTNVSQVLCLVFLAVAFYRIALLLGLRRQPALMAAVTLVWLLPLRRWTLSANVDVFMIAFWTGAVFWLLLYRERPERGSVVAGGLATGLAAGTKTVGLALAALPFAAMSLLLIYRRRFRELGVFAAAVTAAGGGWYLKNLRLYGNPVFPLDLSLPGLHFPGVFTSETLRQSLFRVDLERWLETVRVQFGLPTCVLFVAGFAGLVWMSTPRSTPGGRHRLMAPALLAFVVFWGGYVFAVVPHNNQTRFLIPALVVAQLGWAGWIEAVAHRRARTGIFLLGLGAAAWSSRPDLLWGYRLSRLDASGVGWTSWMVPVLLALSVAGWLGWRGRVSRRNLYLLGGALAVAVLVLGTHYADRSRIAFLARADFRAWATGYLMFNDPTVAPRRIAYSGLNVPYALTGPGLRHHVFYCNTQGRDDDGLYDFWRRDPRLHPTHKPGLYRGQDDFEVWRTCLERRRADTVVLFATIPLERPAHWTMSGEFPVERDWMRQRPDFYEPVLLTPRAEIYRLLPGRVPD